MSKPAPPEGRRYREWVPCVCKACGVEYPQDMALFIRTILDPQPGDAALDYCPACRAALPTGGAA